MEFIDENTKAFCFFDLIVERYKPVSIFGKQAFANISPLKVNEISDHFAFLSRVEGCENNRTRIESILRDFHEIKGSILNIEFGKASEIDIFEIKRFIYHHRMLKRSTPCLKDFFGSFEDLWSLLDPKNTGSFSFAPENSSIEELEKAHKALTERIEKLYEFQVKLISEKFKIVADKRFVIEKDKASDIVNSNLVIVEREGSKTYTLAIRPTYEIIRLQDEISKVEEELKNERDKEVKRLSECVKAWVQLIRMEISKISQFDLAFAQIKAIKDGYTFPNFGDRIELFNAFHPLVLESTPNYTPLDGTFDGGLTIVFGPNMGGKTTVLRTIALSCVLGMYGFLVPSKYAKLPVINWIRYIGLSSQNMDLSTFANQVKDMSNVLRANGKGIILIDEFGIGTNPYEGEALAESLAEYLSQKKNFSIMVTHFKHVIENVKCRKYAIGKINFDEEINAENLSSKIDHHLTNETDVRYGDAIKLASIFGFPAEITECAKKKFQNYL